MKNFVKVLKPAILSLLIMTVLCGVLYTGVITGFAQLIFPHQANGSMITVTLKDGTRKVIGSELIEQEFTQAKYLIGRPMGTSNLNPVSADEQKRIQERVDWWHHLDPTNQKEIPIDLVTGSGSGVDPNVSLAAAEYQVQRIARERHMDASQVRSIIEKYTTGRFLGFWGEPAVNVLKVNLALDGLL